LTQTYLIHGEVELLAICTLCSVILSVSIQYVSYRDFQDNV